MTATSRRAGSSPALAIKAPVVIETTANITLSGTQTVNGVAVVADDRVLVKDQTDATENGVYIVAAGAWSRAPDWSGANDVVKGTRVPTAAGLMYRVTTSNPITIGTTEVALTQDYTIAVSATTVLAGFAELATEAETLAGVDTTRAVTPAGIASLLTTGVVRKIKAADETISSDNTLTNDNNLAGWTITAATKYRVQGQLIVSTGATPDFKYRLNFDNAPVLFYGNEWYDADANRITAVADRVVPLDATNPTVVEFDIVLEGHATLGATLDLQWSQNTSSATSITLYEGSWITVEPWAAT